MGDMGVSKNGGTQQPRVFLLKNDHFGVFWGYHHLRKHPYGEHAKMNSFHLGEAFRYTKKSTILQLYEN